MQTAGKQGLSQVVARIQTPGFQLPCPISLPFATIFPPGRQLSCWSHVHLFWGPEHPPVGASHPGIADRGCLSTALHGPTSKALVHVCARTSAFPWHACTSVQTGARQLRARSHLHVPRSLSRLRTEMPVRAHGGEPRAPCQPPATRGLVPGRLAELSSSCGDGKTRSEASARFPFTPTFRPCIPPHHPRE